MLAGAAFMPFTLIMATLSRWAGGLLDRFGAKGPLIIGPAIAALGFALFAWPIGGRSYWAYLVPIAILGFGMVIAVAPLTTTVIGAVPDHETGIAAGINNAVASVANLLAVAVLGALALGLYDGGLDRHLAAKPLPRAVVRAIGDAKGQFVFAPALGQSSRQRSATGRERHQGIAGEEYPLRHADLCRARTGRSGQRYAAAVVASSATRLSSSITVWPTLP